MTTDWPRGLASAIAKEVSAVPPDRISRTIDLARIALIVGLVFLHYGRYPNFHVSPFGGMSVGEYSVATFVNSFLLFFFFSVVPLLSMISGWLFFAFLHDREPNPVMSLKKRILRRVSSLYLPVILWNALYLALLFLVFWRAPDSPIFDALNLDFRTAGIPEFLNAVFAINHHPLAFQFWFVRDLFLTVLVSPLLWLMLRRAPYLGAAGLLVAWLANYDFQIFFRPDVLFFFYLGGLLRLKRVPLGISWRATLAIVALYVVLVAARAMAPYLLDESMPLLGASTRAMRLVGVVACWGLFLRMASTSLGTRLANWGCMAFFLHAAHFPLIAEIKLLAWRLMPAINDFWMVTHYLVSVIITVLLCLGAGVLLSRYAPGVFALLNGGRAFQRADNHTAPSGSRVRPLQPAPQSRIPH